MEQTSAFSMATFARLLNFAAIASFVFGILFLGAGFTLYYAGLYGFLAFGAWGLTFSLVALGVFSLYLRTKIIKKYS
ncbi:MAG: hypothetical protein ACYCT2_04435 [Thermoplasmataceae archaeon]